MTCGLKKEDATAATDLSGEDMISSEEEVEAIDVIDIDVSRSGSNLYLDQSSFKLMSGYSFGAVADGLDYCLAPKSMTVGAPFRIDPCDEISDFRQWFHFDGNGLMRLSVNPQFCMRWGSSTSSEGNGKGSSSIVDKGDSKVLYLDSCSTNTSLDNSSFSIEDGKVRAIGYKYSASDLWLLGVKNDKYRKPIFIRAGSKYDNESMYMWNKYFASEAPSSSPSGLPTKGKD